eukprot:4616508-Pyramimonas_sp.AAC.1
MNPSLPPRVVDILVQGTSTLHTELAPGNPGCPFATLVTPRFGRLRPSCTVQHTFEDASGALHFIVSVPRLHSASSTLDRHFPYGYGSSCANNGKDALNTPETLPTKELERLRGIVARAAEDVQMLLWGLEYDHLMTEYAAKVSGVHRLVGGGHADALVGPPVRPPHDGVRGQGEWCA